MITERSFYEQKASTFSLVDHAWHMKDNTDGSYPLYATVKWAFVFSYVDGKTEAHLIGPRIVPETIQFKADQYFIGVVFNGGTELSGCNKSVMLNHVIPLRVDGKNFMTISGSSFKIPTYESLDLFVAELVKTKTIRTAPIAAVSHRDKQRKLKRYIGLTPKQIEQATRVERAIELLSSGASIADTTDQSGFADQAHLTRDFRRFVGLSPLETTRFFRNTL